jgi:D-alanyl-D-alanine carboxypeptidase
MKLRRFVGWGVALALVVAPAASAQQLGDGERARVDSTVQAVLAVTGAPSASIAVVRGGRIAYEQAYGEGRVGTPAAPAMRYAIGSVSKQFTATAILLLAEERRLSLDDPVSRWFPDLTRARDVTIRQLLSMTSGYRDDWPQDYVMPPMRLAASVDRIMHDWAGIPLDFDPGAQWQYSNTNYTIAGAIVERVSGEPLMAYLRRRIFTPLGMTTVADFDAGPLSASDAGAYLRYGLGPLREAPKEGRGWLAGAGGLAMTAHDLALWNIAMMDRRVLRPESYRAQQTDVLLNQGTATGYGLGINVSGGVHRRLSHGGAVSGYTTTNVVFPDDRTAITVFTNIYPGGGGASGQIANRIAGILFPPDSAAMAAGDLARRIYDGLMRGTIDRSLFTDNCNAYFDQQALDDYAGSLGPLGAPTEFVAGGMSLRGGMTIRSYRIRAGNATLNLTTMTMPDGRIEQYIVERSG